MAVAVCITGQSSRLELRSKVQNIFAPLKSAGCKRVDVFLVLQEGASVYVNEETKRNDTACNEDLPREAILAQLGPYFRAAAWVNSSDPPELNLANRHWLKYATEKFKRSPELRRRRIELHFRQWGNMEKCAGLIQDAEAAGNMTYDFVLKLRDNSIGVLPFSLAGDLLRHASVKAKKCARFGGMNDKVLFAPRVHALRALSAPMVAARMRNRGDAATLERFRKTRAVNPESFLLRVLGMNEIPVRLVDAELLPITDGRCSYRAENGTKIFRLMEESRDCRP